MSARSRKDSGSKEAKAPRKRAGKVVKVDGRGGARPGAGRPKIIANGDSKPFALRLPGWAVDGIKAGGPAAVEEVRKLIVAWATKRRPKA